MKPPSATTSPAATAAARHVGPMKRRRASRSRTRIHSTVASTASSSAHAAQYPMNQSHGRSVGPKPRMSVYDQAGAEP